MKQFALGCTNTLDKYYFFSQRKDTSMTRKFNYKRGKKNYCKYGPNTMSNRAVSVQV